MNRRIRKLQKKDSPSQLVGRKITLMDWLNDWYADRKAAQQLDWEEQE